MSPQITNHKTLTTSDTANLIAVLIRTLPQAGVDRMTDQRMEELLATPALCAHL